MIAAVVLAAGLSRRMGETDKLRLPVRGMPMYRHALTLAAAVGDACLVVTNDLAIVSEGEGMGFRAVPSPRAAEGMGYSVAAGAAALDARAAYALFLSADQPFLQPETVQALVHLAQESDCIVVPRVDGKPCAPCVFPRRFFGELAALTGETGGRAVWKRHANEVRFWDAPNKAEFADIDTPETYQRLAGLDFPSGL
ncbi:MAG: nucleotidyltransferase family protein [Butyricicoccus sp.]|nr:nucleotidyltransferase family protein [Butyricicoccus sp.]